jgi:putative ABC transport system substrate-binding protein
MAAFGGKADIRQTATRVESTRMTRSGHRLGLKPRSAAVSCRIEVCYPFGRKHGRDRAVNRRSFITLMGGAAATAWPLAARAQQPAVPVIGFLVSFPAESFAPETRPYAASFHRGLSETGYSDGQNVAIEYRWAENQPTRLPILAAELVRRKVAVLAATGGAASALAAKGATTTIPIVFTGGGDPVALGLVASLNRPGGNVTGVTFLANILGAKRLELLNELAPRAGTIGLLVNPNNPNAASDTSDMEAGARAIGKQILLLRASTEQAPQS